MENVGHQITGTESQPRELQPFNGRQQPQKAVTIRAYFAFSNAPNVEYKHTSKPARRACSSPSGYTRRASPSNTELHSTPLRVDFT